MTIPDSVFVHEKALVQSDDIGKGTRIWAFTNIRKGAHIGEDCNICDYAVVDGYIGDRVTLKDYAAVGLGVHVEDDVFIGPQAVTTNDGAPRSPRMRGVPGVEQRYADERNWLLTTRLCRGATIGAGVIVTPGVTVGEFAMISAGAVVVTDVPAHALIQGNPGRQWGWVCFCGGRLTVADDGLSDCEQCQQRFRTTDDGVEAV